MLGSPGFRTEPPRQPDNLRSAHHDHHWPYASCGQCNPEVAEYHLLANDDGAFLHGGHQDGVAVFLGPDNIVSSQIAIRAVAVFDDDGLPLGF
ncbi:hypothetical protein GGE09_004505 [Roseobacter sp. N2S]|nr:hypothetical protein [Roseobacter sp. N2S]MDR6267484.1 hypothetical protein [Roseobacter sp. N2S]